MRVQVRSSLLVKDTNSGLIYHYIIHALYIFATSMYYCSIMYPVSGEGFEGGGKEWCACYRLH